MEERSSTQTWLIDIAKGRAFPASAPLDPDAGPEHLPGERIDRYVVREELGRGGMGVVYRAHDADLARDVALKVIRRGTTEPERLERFISEALVTARLQHPAIIPVYAKGRAESGEVFYTMRLVRGETLDDVLRSHASEGGPEGWTRFKLLQVFVRVCRAIAYAHREGVVHRDLKPNNVMLDSFGSVYVLDWGLARAVGAEEGGQAPLAEDGTSTLASCVVGTPAFMAPEQVRVGPVSPLVDVYGLGGVLYVLLTGREPRVGTQTEAIQHLLSGELPPPPSQVAQDVPAELEDLCRRALDPDPAARLGSAAALADAVQAYLEGRSLQPPGSDGADAAFLRDYRAADYPRPSVTVDLVLLARPSEGPPRVFLHRRPRPPFQGDWACPGVFIRIDEPLEAAAARVLAEEVQLAADPPPLTQLGVYSEVSRDPRTRVISIAYQATTDGILEARSAGGWCEVREEQGGVTVVDGDGAPIPLAFDHARIVSDAVRRLR